MNNKEKVAQLLILFEDYLAHLDKETQMSKMHLGQRISVISLLHHRLLIEEKPLASFNRKELAMIKQEIVERMRNLLGSTRLNDDEKIAKISKFLEAPIYSQGKQVIKTSPRTILETHRSPQFGQFLQKVINILTLGVYSAVTKGTFFGHGKSHGQVANDAVKSIIKSPTSQ